MSNDFSGQDINVNEEKGEKTLDTGHLVFRAGQKAFAMIKDGGLEPDNVKVVAGAAGGPKWFVLRHLDEAIFLSWMKHREAPLFLIGSSIGSWRFAAVSQNDPADAIALFEYAYMHQKYTERPSAEDVSRASRIILDRFINDSKADSILNHPFLRLNIMAVRSRFSVSSDRKASLAIGLAGAYLSNLFNREFLGCFFERALFYDSREKPPFLNMNDFPLRKIPLLKDNLKDALLASGSIPFVMTGVKDIKGAPKGVYRDGGVIDYHFDIPFLNHEEAIVLYPHYLDRLIPGWMDKKLPWRKPKSDHMDHVLLVFPSQSFIESLPYGRIPDRVDFKAFFKRDEERISYWKKVVHQSRVLGDEFIDVVESGKIRDVVLPL